MLNTLFVVLIWFVFNANLKPIGQVRFFSFFSSMLHTHVHSLDWLGLLILAMLVKPEHPTVRQAIICTPQGIGTYLIKLCSSCDRLGLADDIGLLTQEPWPEYLYWLINSLTMWAKVSSVGSTMCMVGSWARCLQGRSSRCKIIQHLSLKVSPFMQRWSTRKTEG